MEVSNALANNVNALQQAVSMAMLRKTMGMDANVVSELLPDAQAASAAAMDVPVDPNVGGNVDMYI